MRVLANHVDFHLELTCGELGLAQELAKWIHQNTSARAPQLHLDRKIARIAAEVEDGFPGQIRRHEGFDQFPPVLGQIPGLAAVSRPKPIRQFKMLIPPAQRVEFVLRGFAVGVHK